MDYSKPPTSWVERAIVEVRTSPTYRSKIDDEFYETLPVPAWSAQQNWLVIGFGEIHRFGPPPAPFETLMPHIACAVSYPDGQQHWSLDEATAHVWPVGSGLADAAIPPPVIDGLLEREQQYYTALSKALALGAFAAHAPADQSAACAAAREVRTLFLPAATYPNLAKVYARPVADMDGWLATHCANP